MGRLSQKEYEQHDGKAAPTSAAPEKGHGEEGIYQQTISERSDNVPEWPATVVKAQDVIDMMQDSKSAAQQHEPLAAGEGTVEADCHNFHVNTPQIVRMLRMSTSVGKKRENDSQLHTRSKAMDFIGKRCA